MLIRILLRLCSCLSVSELPEPEPGWSESMRPLVRWPVTTLGQEQCEWGLPAPVHTGITPGVIYDQARLNVSCVNYNSRNIAFSLLWCHHTSMIMLGLMMMWPLAVCWPLSTGDWLMGHNKLPGFQQIEGSRKKSPNHSLNLSLDKTIWMDEKMHFYLVV